MDLGGKQKPTAILVESLRRVTSANWGSWTLTNRLKATEVKASNLNSGLATMNIPD